MSTTEADITVRCSFCTKTNHEVAKLIAGPGVAHDVVDDLNTQARRLRDRGVGWDRIGEALGITGREAETRFEPAT